MSLTTVSEQDAFPRQGGLCLYSVSRYYTKDRNSEYVFGT